MNNKKQGLNITTFKVSKKLQIQQVHQTTFEEMGTGYETIKLEDNTEEDRVFLDVTEDMSEAEIREYEELKAKRREKAYSRFPKKNNALDTDIERPHAHLDNKWQSEIARDVIDEMRY